MHSSGKTPLIRLAKRDGMAGAGQWGIRIAAILLALVVGRSEERRVGKEC